MSVLSTMQVVLVVTIAVGVSGGMLAWRERPEPGALPLTAFLAGACWWSATLFFQLEATTLTRKVFWIDLSWVGIAVIPVAWLFFCLAYTGYTDYLKPRYVVLASVVPVLTAVIGVTNEFHGLLYTGSQLVDQGGTPVLSRTPGPWFWVAAASTYLLGFLGAVPLVQFVTSEVSTFRGQSLALLVGLVTPWLTNVLFLAGMLPTGGIDPTPVAFSVSAVVFLGALTRFRLLDTSPAPIRPARRMAFDRMEGGIAVLDRRHNVVDVNERAAAALGAGNGDPLGQDVRTLSPQFERLLDERSRSDSIVFQPEGTAETYDVSLAELTDTHGRILGRIVTFHDISEYLRQQQRLEVLNRVFRHNIRTNSQVLLGHLDHLAQHNDEEMALEGRDRVMELTEFGDKIRTILDMFERGRTETEPLRVQRIVEGVVGSTRETYPEVAIHTNAGVEGLYVDAIGRNVLAEVVENAAEHNTNDHPEVWVDVTDEADRVVITVGDNGPGIYEEELALLREGSETPLNHGSGLGLALVIWGTDIVGGRITIEDRDPVGTEVTLEFPIVQSGAAVSHAEEAEPE